MVGLLKLAEVAQQLGVSETKARRLVKSGELRSVRVGNRYRVRDTDLEAFLLQAEVRPGESAPKVQAPPFSQQRAQEERRIDFKAYAASIDGFTSYWDLQVRVKGRRLDRQEFHDYVEAVRAIVLGLREVMRVADTRDRSVMKPTLQRFVIVANAVGELAEDKDAVATLNDALQPIAA